MSFKDKSSFTKVIYKMVTAGQRFVHLQSQGLIIRMGKKIKQG